MKKSLTMSLLLMFVFCGFVQARTVYDPYGRIIKDDTLRGRRRQAEQQQAQQRYFQSAAAARIDYDAAMRELDRNNGMQSNYIQDRVINQSY